MIIDSRLRSDNPTKYYLKKTKSVTVIRTCHDVSTCWHFFSEKTVTINKKAVRLRRTALILSCSGFIILPAPLLYGSRVVYPGYNNVVPVRQTLSVLWIV